MGDTGRSDAGTIAPPTRGGGEVGVVRIRRSHHRADQFRWLCRDLRAARDMDGIGAAVQRWVHATLDGDVSIAISRPNTSGHLRVAWRSGLGPEASRSRAARRRAVFGSGRATLVRVADRSPRSLAMFPLMASGRAFGVLEVTAPEASIDAHWRPLGAVAEQVGLCLNVLDLRLHGNDVDAPDGSPEPPASMPGDPSAAVDRAAKADPSRPGRPPGGWEGIRVPGNRTVDMGLAVTAHEIRAPLLGVRAVLEVLLERVTADPEDVKILRRSIRELGRLAGDTQDLLTWAASVRHLRPMEADIVQVVNEAVDSCRMETGEDRVVVVAPPSVRAPIDAPQLRSAVTNLIRNALAYADPGTKVEITLRERRDDVLLSVRDRGPLIPAADRARIFDPFVRGSAKGHVGEQSGLGLYITRRVVEEHGGEIWVESDRSETAFLVRLPTRKGGERRFAS